MTHAPDDDPRTSGTGPEASARAEDPTDSRSGSLGRQIAASYGASGTFRRDERGQIDVLHAVGGVRGLLEATLPSLVFLIAFLATEQLGFSLLFSVGVAVLAAVTRLAQRGNVVQALSGAVGVGVCALFARVGGHAIDYYVPGFWTNGIYLVATLVSMAVRWPLIGLFYGFLRGEDVAWRRDPRRLRAYQGGTAIFAGMLVLRLAVQLPLYAAGLVGALGAARLVMGLPFYLLVLWLAWLATRPDPTEPEGPVAS